MLTRLKERQEQRAKLKKDINDLVKSINRKAESNSVSWAVKKKIQELLSGYDLKRRTQKTLDQRAELSAYLAENPEAFDTMNERDTKHLGATTLNDMSVDDLRTLAFEVENLYFQGRREFEDWQMRQQERADTLHSELRAALEKVKSNVPIIQQSPEDMSKQYKGLRGKAEQLKDFIYANTLGSDRFFDSLDSGATGYKGAFVRHFVDESNRLRNESSRHIFDRRAFVQSRLDEIGVRVADFAQVLTEVEGVKFTVDGVMEIYVGMRNEEKRNAILYGTFKNIKDPEGTVAHLIGLLTDEQKQAAEVVVEDHEQNVDRIEEAFINAANSGFERAENYTSIHRMEHSSPMGIIDAETADAMAEGGERAGMLRRVDDGFTKSRLKLGDKGQTPIKLGLFSNWHSDVSRQEHSAVMAEYSKITRKALLALDPDGETIATMIKGRFGVGTWRAMVNFHNANVTDDVRAAHDFLDGAARFMTRNMVVTYLAGNLSTVMKQFTSIPRFLITAGPQHLFSSTAQFLASGPEFLDRIYELDPQMKGRMGSPLLAALRESPAWGQKRYQQVLDMLLAPIAIADRWVAAIGWQATYNANVKQLGHEGAVREAARATRLTQQPAYAKDTAMAWRTSGFVRLVSIFTSDAAQTWGMTVYDLAQQVKTKQWHKGLATLTALALTGVLIKAASDGFPSDDDDEGWLEFIWNAFNEQFITSIPLLGKEIMALYDNLSGKYRGTQYSALVTPVEKALRAYKLWADEDSEGDDFNRATWLAVEALSLGGVAPVPVTSMRRAWNSVGILPEEGPLAATLNLFGVRRKQW